MIPELERTKAGPVSEVPVETSSSPALGTGGGTPQGFHWPHWLEVTKSSFQSLPSQTSLPAMLLARAGGRVLSWTPHA